MLKRLLASLAIVSLLAAALLLVYWWRSNHGHMDEFTLGATGTTQTHFMSQNGRVMIRVTNKSNSQIDDRIQPYTFYQALGWCLIFPGFWLAVTVRNLLPRPHGGGMGSMQRLKR